MKEWFRNLNKTDVRNYLAVVSTVGLLTILLMLLFFPIPKVNVEVFYTTLVLVGQGFGGVMGYYFAANKLNSKKEADEKENP